MAMFQPLLGFLSAHVLVPALPINPLPGRPRGEGGNKGERVSGQLAGD